ncbi:DUF6603 domain-containing protein [Streptomyces albus]|uniref:DUF6603 domain-containing protein n=1 Tax=Streptomyces albus TaxID=1888 RepID=UPI0033EC8F17
MALHLPARDKRQGRKDQVAEKMTVALGLSGRVLGRDWTVRVASGAVGEAGKRVTALLAHGVGALGLTDLPVVGPRLPEGTGRITAVAVLGRTGGRVVDHEALLRLLKHAEPDVPLPLDVPSSALGALISVGVGVQLLPRSTTYAVWASTGGKRPELPAAAEAPESLPARPPAAPVPAPSSGDGQELVVWVKADARLGPLRVRRVGLVYHERRLWVLLDASLGIAVIALDVVGLGLKIPLAHGQAVEGTLDGLGVAFAAGPVRVAGALARAARPPDHLRLMISGALVATMPRLSFAVAGMYAELKDGSTSVFVIGHVSGLRIPLGPVLLNGLIGGFGYNSQLVLPDAPENVPSHPLVGGLQDSGKLPLKDGPAGVLAALRDTVRPQAGYLWAAAGVELTLFELVQARLVLAAQVAPKDVTVALLGMAGVQFPAVPGRKPYACVTLGLKAVYRSATGEISVRGALDPAQSYLLHPDCRLSGGFALCTWAPPSPHAGDFVVTLGGYHPAFKRPGHYPDVPRIGLQWSTGSEVSVRGECYAALTPGMLMAGGRLRMDYRSRRVSAWLEAHLDALVQWAPFSYRVSMGIDIGAEVYALGTRRVELGADLTLWGPPTGGVLEVHLPVIGDIAVRFGPGPPGRADHLDWDTFRRDVLGNRTVEAVVSDGLLPDRPVPDGQSAVQRVDRNGFQLSVVTPVPCTHLRVRTGTGTNEYETLFGSSTQRVALRPMGKPEAATVCELRLLTSDNRYVRADTWPSNETRARLPAAAFGAPLKADQSPGAHEPALCEAKCTGATLTVPGPTAEGVLDRIPKHRLDATSGATGRLRTSATSSLGLATGTRQDIADTMTGDTALGRRNELCGVLEQARLAPGPGDKNRWDRPDRYAPAVYTYATTDPLSATG